MFYVFSWRSFFIPAFKAHNELERESKAVLKGSKVRIEALPALGAAPPVNTLEYWRNVGMAVWNLLALIPTSIPAGMELFPLTQLGMELRDTKGQKTTPAQENPRIPGTGKIPGF